jgi:hypothetical protein
MVRPRSQVSHGLPGPRIDTVPEMEMEFSVEVLSELHAVGRRLSSS